MTDTYIDVDALKASLDAANTSYLNEDLEQSAAAASGMVDDICERRFGKSEAPEARYFRGNDPRYLQTDDLLSVTSIEIDVNNDGVYEDTLTVGVEVRLGPVNAPSKGNPYTYLEKFPAANGFPRGGGYVKITGVFGWAEVPQQVIKATRILTVRLVMRDRQAPMGILGAGTEGAIEIMRSDPEIGPLLRRFIKTPQIQSLRMR